MSLVKTVLVPRVRVSQLRLAIPELFRAVASREALGIVLQILLDLDLQLCVR